MLIAVLELSLLDDLARCLKVVHLKLMTILDFVLGKAGKQQLLLLDCSSSDVIIIRHD